MEKRHRAYQLLHVVPKIAAGLSIALGLVVLVGWYTHNVILIQIFPIFVPESFKLHPTAGRRRDKNISH
jgi:hypothetical protein